jgi:hypothetical protein
MSSQKHKPDLNDDIDWDYNCYQGRSKGQVESNQKVMIWALAVIISAFLGFLISEILQKN